MVNRGTNFTSVPSVNGHVGPATPTAEQVNAAEAERGNLAGARVAEMGAEPTRGFVGSLNTVRTAPRSPGFSEGAGMHAPSAFNPGGAVHASSAFDPGMAQVHVRDNPAFSGDPGRVFAPGRSTQVYNTAPMSTFRSAGTFHNFTYPSYYHSYGGSPATRVGGFNNAGFSHVGGFNNAGASHVGGFNNGGFSHPAGGVSGGGFHGGGGGGFHGGGGGGGGFHGGGGGGGHR